MREIELEDHDHRTREPQAHEYFLAACGSGRVVCYRKGLAIIEFYRSTNILAPAMKEENDKQKAIDRNITKVL